MEASAQAFFETVRPDGVVGKTVSQFALLIFFLKNLGFDYLLKKTYIFMAIANTQCKKDADTETVIDYAYLTVQTVEGAVTKQATIRITSLIEEARRESFELDYLGGNKQTARRNEHGFYVLPSIQDAWSGWQAAYEFLFKQGA